MRCAHIMKSLCLYEHGKICRRIHCELLAWRPLSWFAKKKKKCWQYQPIKKGFESSLPTPSEPSSRELGVFTVSTVSLLLPTLYLRCWGNNKNKKIWWIIRGPMMLCVTVRTTPPTLYPLWAQQLWRTPPPSRPPIKFSGSERTWARSLKMKMLSRGLDLLNEKKQVRNSSWVLCRGRSNITPSPTRKKLLVLVQDLNPGSHPRPPSLWVFRLCRETRNQLSDPLATVFDVDKPWGCRVFSHGQV